MYVSNECVFLTYTHWCNIISTLSFSPIMSHIKNRTLGHVYVYRQVTVCLICSYLWDHSVTYSVFKVTPTDEELGMSYFCVHRYIFSVAFLKNAVSLMAVVRVPRVHQPLQLHGLCLHNFVFLFDVLVSVCFILCCTSRIFSVLD